MKLLPAQGIYAVRAHRGGATISGVANIGTCPTFENCEFSLEVHLFDFNEDLLRREPGSGFYRPAPRGKALPSIEALAAQIMPMSPRPGGFWRQISSQGPGKAAVRVDMIRHQASCQYCGHTSHWCRNREESRQEILRHLKEAHNCGGPREPQDYQIVGERQCDTCLELTSTTAPKRRGFCVFHAGDIDGSAAAAFDHHDGCLACRAAS